MSRGYAIVGLVDPKIPANVGSALRAAWCYEAVSVVVQGLRYTSRGSQTDTPKAWKHLPLHNVKDVIGHLPVGCEAVAIELVSGAHSLPNFVHPERAMYVFGPEDGSVPKDVLDRCRYKIMVPTRNCMNLAATVNVVLYDRMVKSRSN